MRFPIPLLSLVVAFSALVGCGGDASDGTTAAGPTFQTTRADLACPGTPVTTAEGLDECPAPFAVRPGHACAEALTCPSIDLLYGTCRCDGSAWTCEKDYAPQNYDPFPDCPEDGIEPGGACYLEGSKCVPRAVSACFTSGVALCECKGHGWTC